jgi:phosphopantothenoylcysteine decarboxylase/phosphopantothenate--cysteine ligase
VLNGKRILLIVTGGIAAYKCMDAIRRLRAKGAAVRCVLSQGGAQFVTPLALAALSGEKVYENLFQLTDESKMGHIRLSREADLVLVAPASANFLAKIAHGLADDLATTVFLATDKPVLAAPAMNIRMWDNAATAANLELLSQRGVHFVGPVEGDMACGEFGIGRMAEADDIVAAVEDFFCSGGRLEGRRALVTSGPTFEAIDPMRYIANRSSGKQGHAIAAALARRGAETTLVSGPTHEPDPPKVKVVRVESARQMLAACKAALPVDAAVCAAAVADWRVAEEAACKIKKTGTTAPVLALTENPDILSAISKPGNRRPRLVVGFAAETNKVIDNALAKRQAKGCDWIVANDVSPGTGVMGGNANTVHLITTGGVENWPRMSKPAVAERLTERISELLEAAS